MKLEAGKKYKRHSDIVEVKFVDGDGDGWGLSTDGRCICVILDYGWQEVTDKPDPGEGWRLLHPDEDLESGDECYLKFDDPYDDWAIVSCSNNKQTPGMFYRRRTTPQYVPYTWDDREELRGRWYRQKDYPEHERLVAHLEMSSNEIEVNGWGAEKFLQKCEWLDGSPCGKKAV
jgi:hypothetical protein